MVRFASAGVGWMDAQDNKTSLLLWFHNFILFAVRLPLIVSPIPTIVLLRTLPLTTTPIHARIRTVVVAFAHLRFQDNVSKFRMTFRVLTCVDVRMLNMYLDSPELCLYSECALESWQTSPSRYRPAACS